MVAAQFWCIDWVTIISCHWSWCCFVFSTVIASNLLLVDEIMRAGLSSLKGWWVSSCSNFACWTSNWMLLSIGMILCALRLSVVTMSCSVLFVDEKHCGRYQISLLVLWFVSSRGFQFHPSLFRVKYLHVRWLPWCPANLSLYTNFEWKKWNCNVSLQWCSNFLSKWLKNKLLWESIFWNVILHVKFSVLENR